MLGAGFPELHIHFDVAEDYGNCSITLQCKALGARVPARRALLKGLHAAKVDFSAK
jgi:hypothetical protein